MGAALFDMVILAILTSWLTDIFGVARNGDGQFVQTAGAYTYVATRMVVAWPWLLLLALAYFSVSELLFGATCGKFVAGLRVVDLEGRRPAARAIIVRNLLRIVDYWPTFYVVGLLAAALSPRRQRLGDRVAGTIVVRVEAAVLAGRTRTELRARRRGLTAVLLLVCAGCMAFSYFGRPTLVIDGLAHTTGLYGRMEPRSYTLGAPHWHAGRVTYPIRYLHGGARCLGSVTLRWTGFFRLGGGWVLDSAARGCGQSAGTHAALARG